MTVKLWLKHLFQSTPPVKAATIAEHQHRNRVRISIHAAREGGDALACYIVKKDKISIHAAREGGDRSLSCSQSPQTISIHAAREGGDYYPPLRTKEARYFNPRRP